MKKVFVIIFCLVISLPLLQMATKIFPDVRLEEKRELAKLPTVNLDQKSLEGATVFYDDHFGFRGSLIFLNNYLDLSLFKISPNPQVKVGKNGWLYYLPSYQSNEVGVNKDEVERIVEKIKNFDDKMVFDDKRFVFVLAPNKESIYPEFLSEKLKGEKNYEVIMEALLYGNVNAFDALKPLEEAKKRGEAVYSKNDTHWTRYGLFLTVNGMLEAIGRDQMVSQGLEMTKRVGDLSLLVGFSNSEDVPQPIVDKNKIKPEERVLIFHDSFFDNEMYFDLVFDNFKKIHWGSDPIEEQYEAVRDDYDVVIFEIAERDFMKLGEVL